jgi:hypothetical protein
MFKKLLGACVGLAMMGMAGTAGAAVLNVSGGQLLGAHNVDVLGTLYDVTFLDGLCSDLFSGCDETSDFAFSDQPTATAAGQALLDQVFIDTGLGAFDSFPNLTTGCPGGYVCDVYIPFVFDNGVNSHYDVYAENYSAANGSPDISNCCNQADSNFNTDSVSVWGVFAPAVVPIPPAALLFATGLAGLGLMGWKRGRRKGDPGAATA